MEKVTTPGLSRRSFLGATSIALAGALGAGITACSPAQESTQSKAEELWDKEFDVIVVGAGIAGLASAVTVADEGNGATCLLVEKGASPSGNSPFSGGACFYTDDPEGLAQYLAELDEGSNATPQDVLDAFAKEAADNMDWILALGANPEEMYIGPAGSPEDPIISGAEYPELEHSYAFGSFQLGYREGGGEIEGPAHIFDFLMKSVQDRLDTIDYRTNCALRELVVDGSGRVVGVVNESGERYGARKGVVMCCGGFESNPAMMQDYLGQGKATPAAGVTNTGDGHKACAKIGADMWHMGNAAGFWMAPRDKEDTAFLWGAIPYPWPKAHGITVGVNGRRYYMDYDCVTSYFGGDYLSDMSLSVGCKHGHQQFGGQYSTLPMPTKSYFIFDKVGLEAGAVPESVLASANAEELCHVANSIPELAQLIGVVPEELETTVDQWNECCAQGKDVYFHRPEQTLTPVNTPPFYAQLCAPTFLNTDGGPRRAANGQIIDVFGNPIAGLFSAGEFGSVWGHLYQGAGNIGECLAFGRISARSALEA